MLTELSGGYAQRCDGHAKQTASCSTTCRLPVVSYSKAVLDHLLPACSSAKNLDTGEKVAIKKIANAFDNVIDAKRTLREIKLLKHLQHENIVQIKDSIPPMQRDAFKDLYVVYELMDTDLHQIIRSPQPLSNDHSQYFLYQVGPLLLLLLMLPSHMGIHVAISKALREGVRTLPPSVGPFGGHVRRISDG